MNIESAVKNLEQRGFVAHYFETGKEAAEYVSGQLNGQTIGIGGSSTVMSIGLYEELEKNNTVYWHHKVPGPEVAGKATAAPVYITSANAIAETGEVLNIDGRGNRVAGYLYEKDVVYIIAGTNKLCPDYDAAMKRAREVAAPRNAQRLNTKTPCAVDGKCHDCKGPTRICNAAVALWGRPFGVERIEVVLINEELGL